MKNAPLIPFVMQLGNRTHHTMAAARCQGSTVPVLTAGGSREESSHAFFLFFPRIISRKSPLSPLGHLTHTIRTPILITSLTCPGEGAGIPRQ